VDTAVIPSGESLALAFKVYNLRLLMLHSLVAERADGGLLTTFLVE
jgi:hypothetical protein